MIIIINKNDASMCISIDVYGIQSIFFFSIIIFLVWQDIDVSDWSKNNTVTVYAAFSCNESLCTVK